MLSKEDINCKHNNKGEHMRNLVSIKTIDKISPIEGADFIERATLGGWNVVVKKGLYNEGDRALYLEIDSVLPEDNPVFKDFMKHGVKNVTTFDGKELRGHVLRTVRLRGVYSQGALIPLSEISLDLNSTQEQVDAWGEQQGVFKYEPPAVFSNSGILGTFPNKYARQTDSERVQNLSDDFLQKISQETSWIPSEKIDGMSATFFKDEQGVLRAASRNYEVDTTQGIFAEIIQKYELDTRMEPGSVIQGEIFGEGIQKNTLKKKGHHLAVFSHNDIGSEEYLLWLDKEMKVPIYDGIEFPLTVEQAVEQVNGLKSLMNPNVQAEGIVWWNTDGIIYPEIGDRANFKAINNKFLLKNG